MFPLYGYQVTPLHREGDYKDKLRIYEMYGDTHTVQLNLNFKHTSG